MIRKVGRPRGHAVQTYNSALILTLNGVDFFNAFAMTIFAKLRPQPCSHNLAHFLIADRLTAQAKNVCIVVLTRIACNRNGVTSGSPHPGNLVRRPRDSDPCTVDHYADIRTPGSNRASYRMSKIRVINRVFRVGAEVMDRMAQLLDQCLELLFHFEPTVIGAYGNQ